MSDLGNRAGPLFPPRRRVYSTPFGTQVAGDSLELLRSLPDESVDLIMTSPPFALLRKKSYGNEDQAAYVDWLAQFGRAAKRVLKPSGSLVLDIGNAYQRGTPTRSLYPYRVLLEFVDELGYFLAEEFFWHNPAKLPSPVEWVNKRRIRVKDSVNTVWWFSKTEWPQADVNAVLVPYSGRMRELLKDPGAFYDAKERPSEHSISVAFGTDNGGAIPSNLLQIANTDSNSHYLRTCRSLGLRSHPARFPEALPRFFIDFLTKPGDLVLDIFSGSNTTGMVAESRGRRWLSFELDRSYAALSILRFLEGQDPRTAKALYESAMSSEVNLPTDMVRVAEAVASTRAEEAAEAVDAMNVVRLRVDGASNGDDDLQKELAEATAGHRRASVAARAAAKGAELARAARAANRSGSKG